MHILLDEPGSLCAIAIETNGEKMEIFQLPPDGNKEEVYARSFLRIAFISEEAPEEGSFRIPVRL